MRSPYEDYALLVEAGFWNDARDPLMNAVTLLCMHAKARHRPVRNLHHLANAVAEGDARAVKKYHARLSDEVSRTLRKYPDIEGTLRTMSQMTDDDMDQIDRVMQEQTSLVEADAPKPAWDENDVLAIIEILEPAMTELATTPDGQLLMYPDWLMRTWLKMEIAGVLELLDDVAAVVAAGPDPELDVGRLSLETHADVEELYDRVFDAHDLGGLVSEVIRRVALRGDDAKAYAESQKPSCYAGDWRPATYWPPLPTDEDLVGRIRGAERREQLRVALASGDLTGVDPDLLREALTVGERRALMAAHPYLTLGEYLPELDDQDLPGGEVEIARLYLASGAGNTISIRAKRQENDILLGAVDEYEHRLRITPTRVTKPLTNAQLLAAARSLEFVGPMAHGAVWRTRELEAEVDIEAAAEFISGESELYPAFGGLVEDDNREWLEAQWSLAAGDEGTAEGEG